jgi:hypothetical protein
LYCRFIAVKENTLLSSVFQQWSAKIVFFIVSTLFKIGFLNDFTGHSAKRTKMNLLPGRVILGNIAAETKFYFTKQNKTSDLVFL